MPLILQSRIYRADLKANPAALYVFGDNEERWGLGGQAREMRGEPNAHGVATLKAPGVFWTDDEFTRQCAVIDVDMLLPFKRLRDGVTIVFPLDGIGTGLADLAARAPRTFAYLQTQIAALKAASENR